MPAVAVVVGNDYLDFHYKVTHMRCYEELWISFIGRGYSVEIVVEVDLQKLLEVVVVNFGTALIDVKFEVQGAGKQIVFIIEADIAHIMQIFQEHIWEDFDIAPLLRC